jgi:hypothetical protein
LNKLESIFFQVLSDLKEYLENLTLVGGWVPYIYAKYLWKQTKIMPLATVDIDIGVGKVIEKIPSQTIYEKLYTKYKHRHLRMDRPSRDIVLTLENVEIHFISSEDISQEIITNLIGMQLDIGKVRNLEILTENRLSTMVVDKNLNKYKLYIPTPSAFIFHKGLTFVDREYEEKRAKDLYYMYYVLRFCPDIDKVLEEINKFSKEKIFKDFQENIRSYFERISSEGCLMVEKENGPDDYVDNLRKDIFERFKPLYKI